MTVSARRQPQDRRGAWIALASLAILSLLGLGLWAYFGTRTESAPVMRRDIVAFVPLNGKVIAPPNARADVMAPYQAPVDRVMVSVGQRVRQGEVLVELSYPSAQVAYEQARQQVKAAETALANARRQYQASLDAAQQQFNAARAAEQAARRSATGSATTATGTATTPPATAPAPGTVSVTEPAADLEAATAQRQAAEMALQQTRADMQAALAPYQRDLEAARQAFREAQSGRKMASVRAPLNGTVLALNARPGEEAGRAPGTPLVTIVDLGALQVHAELDADHAGQVKPGTPVSVTVETLANQTFPGEVTRIVTGSAKPLGGQKFLAIIDFKNEQGLVKPEMKATAAVRLGEVKNVLAVPSDAVDKDRTGRPIAKVLRGSQWQTVVVETGLSDGRYTEIRSGLNEGDRVQVTPDLI